jgi:hypothetical protein
MVVGRPTSMQQTHHHIKDEPHNKQDCRKAQRLAVDHETTSLSDLDAS